VVVVGFPCYLEEEFEDEAARNWKLELVQIKEMIARTKFNNLLTGGALVNKFVSRE